MPRPVFICIFKLQGTEFSQFSVVRYDGKSHYWHGYVSIKALVNKVVQKQCHGRSLNSIYCKITLTASTFTSFATKS